MSPSKALSPGNISETRLPKRDFIILPLLCFLTIATCLLASEVITRHFFAKQGTDFCRIPDDRIGYRYRPNCRVRLKTAEGPWVTNEYNECGYRTKESCGPKPPGTTRIALLGASVSEGLYIPYDQTFAEKTARGLTQILARPVEVQNLGRVNASPISVFHQVREALALKPDLLMMVVDPYDIEHLDPGQMPDRYKPISALHGASDTPLQLSRSPLKGLENQVKESSTATAGAHLLFQNSVTYIRIYLHYGDHADYLRQPLSPLWEKRLEALDVLIAEMASKSNAQHVPFVLIEVPSFAQAALLKMQTLPAGVDPFLLSTPLQQTASRHGVQFINTLNAFRRGPDPNEMFYVVDTHLNAEGQGLVSRVLVEELIKEQRSALMGMVESQREDAKER
jgi:hypothetical protein